MRPPIVVRASVVFAIIMGALPPLARANRVGAFAGLNGSVASGGLSCMICHGTVVGAGMVQILNAPAQYQSAVSYDLVVRVSDPNELGAGFEISAEDAVGNHIGTLILSDPVNTRIAPGAAGWVTHTATGVNNSVINWNGLGHAAEYAVRWEAPPADMGPVTFYAAGNAINNNFLVTGDHVYLTNVTAMPPAVVPGDFDGDGDADLADWAAMVGCLQGPGVMPTNGQCLVLDADQDDDIDLRDVAVFQRNFTGPG